MPCRRRIGRLSIPGGVDQVCMTPEADLEPGVYRVEARARDRETASVVTRIVGSFEINDAVVRGPNDSAELSAVWTPSLAAHRYAEAQLFGHMKGAYTGATESKPGLVEDAAGGTLFLDEFGALPPAAQAMLLIFLETGQFSRLRSATLRKSNARVIAATNRDLGAAIAEGEFREDLVARLTVRYKLPPLRERREEIACIVDRHIRANGGSFELTEDAMFRLRNHDWRGNVRELLSVIDYCMVVAEEGSIGLDLVEDGIREPADRGEAEVGRGGRGSEAEERRGQEARAG